MDLKTMCPKLCEAERERLTTAEICIDEALTIMDRHGVLDNDPIYQAAAMLSGQIHSAMSQADGYQVRLDRMKRVRGKLTDAFPMSDEDFGRHDQ